MISKAGRKTLGGGRSRRRRRARALPEMFYAVDNIAQWGAQKLGVPKPAIVTNDGQRIHASKAEADTTHDILVKQISEDLQIRNDQGLPDLPAEIVETTELLGGAGFAVGVRGRQAVALGVTADVNSSGGIPNRTIASDVNGKPSNNLAGSADGDTTQALRSADQNSTTRLSPDRRARIGDPLYITGPSKTSGEGVLEIGTGDSATGRMIAQASDSVDENLAKATESKPIFDDALTEIEGAVDGAAFKAARVQNHRG